MATQTTTQRQAAGKKAAATRKRNAAKRSAATTKGSARQTGRTASASARQTARSTRATARSAERTAERQLDAAGTRVGALTKQVERVVLIQIGAVATVRDALLQSAQTYVNVTKRTRELNKLERRGERAVKHSRLAFGRRRRGVEHDLDGWRSDASKFVESVVSGS